MYYVGWTRGVSVPYISAIGLAISNNINGKFKKHSEAPIIGKNPHDPIFTASCFVQYLNNKFKMIYTSNKNWEKKPFFIPSYNLKLAHSNNGIDWRTTDKFLLKKRNNEIAITRPWIITADKKTYITYSYKDYKKNGRNYKIGIAQKIKKSFIRKDKSIKIINKEIDGEALQLISQSDLVKLMKIKLGPALKIWNYILKLKDLSNIN